jgi:hypothetical protein
MRHSAVPSVVSAAGRKVLLISVLLVPACGREHLVTTSWACAPSETRGLEAYALPVPGTPGRPLGSVTDTVLVDGEVGGARLRLVGATDRTQSVAARVTLNDSLVGYMNERWYPGRAWDTRTFGNDPAVVWLSTYIGGNGATGIPAYGIAVVARAPGLRHPHRMALFFDGPDEGSYSDDRVTELGWCAGEAHFQLGQSVYSVRRAGQDSLVLAGWAAPLPATSLPGLAYNTYMYSAGPLRSQLSVTKERFEQMTWVVGRANRMGARPLVCTGPMQPTDDVGAIRTTFQCSNGSTLSDQKLWYDLAGERWMLHDVGDAEATPIAFSVPTAAVLEEFEALRAGVEAHAEPGSDADMSRPSAPPECSLEAATNVLRQAVAGQTVPEAQIGRSTTWTPAGPCAWTVEGLVGWRDPLSQEPIMLPFGAAVSGRDGRYQVDVLNLRP